jgi:hypothetical protein
MLRAQGVIITEIVPEILDFLMQRRTPLMDFLATPSGPSCEDGSGSPCDEFRGQLIDFFADVAALRDRFPAISQLGLGDGTLAARLLERMPGFVLFPAYEVLNRIPDWQQVPQRIGEVIDEIGDPDAFSIDWRQEILGAAASTAAIPSRTASERFCERFLPTILEAPPRMDPVLLNRVKVIANIIKLITASAAEYVPQSLTVSILGEGAGNIPIPVQPTVKALASLVDLVGSIVETRRANLDVCRGRLREFENDLVGRTARVQYRTQAGSDELYFYLSSIIGAAQARLQDVTEAVRRLNIAQKRRTERKWEAAFQRMCEAYELIGREP